MNNYNTGRSQRHNAFRAMQIGQQVTTAVQNFRLYEQQANGELKLLKIDEAEKVFTKWCESKADNPKFEENWKRNLDLIAEEFGNKEFHARVQETTMNIEEQKIRLRSLGIRMTVLACLPVIPDKFRLPGGVEYLFTVTKDTYQLWDAGVPVPDGMATQDVTTSGPATLAHYWDKDVIAKVADEVTRKLPVKIAIEEGFALMTIMDVKVFQYKPTVAKESRRQEIVDIPFQIAVLDKDAPKGQGIYVI